MGQRRSLCQGGGASALPNFRVLYLCLHPLMQSNHVGTVTHQTEQSTEPRNLQWRYAGGISTWYADASCKAGGQWWRKRKWCSSLLHGPTLMVRKLLRKPYFFLQCFFGSATSHIPSGRSPCIPQFMGLPLYMFTTL